MAGRDIQSEWRAGRIKKYQMDPRWDEMTAEQRAFAETLTAQQREDYMDSLDLVEDEEDEYGE